MNYHDIKKCDQTNGDGFRVTLFVSGCEHKCFKCQNIQTWSCDSGIPFDSEAVREIEEELEKEGIDGLTISGGDPLHPNNIEEVALLCCELKRSYPDKTIWIYTGYTIEHLLLKALSDFYLHLILTNIDVLVDGKYCDELRQVDLKRGIDPKWRGSSNQRVIDMKETAKLGEIVLKYE